MTIACAALFAGIMALPGNVDGHGEFFADLETIYVLSFEDFIEPPKREGHVWSIAFGREATGITARPLPDKLWKKLAQRLEAKGVDLIGFVPLSEIKYRDGALVHEPTGEGATIFSMEMSWPGGVQIYVNVRAYSAQLDGYGRQLTLEKRNDRWMIVERSGDWVS